jgi:hypothetical protein
MTQLSALYLENATMIASKIPLSAYSNIKLVIVGIPLHFQIKILLETIITQYLYSHHSVTILMWYIEYNIRR